MVAIILKVVVAIILKVVVAMEQIFLDQALEATADMEVMVVYRRI